MSSRSDAEADSASKGPAYNATAQHCTYSAQPRPVSQSCQAQGGYYDRTAPVLRDGLAIAPGRPRG